MRALAAVYRDEDPPVVCAETTAPDVRDGERLVEGCLCFALDALAAQGVDEVRFDGHVTDPHFLPNWVKLARVRERSSAFWKWCSKRSLNCEARPQAKNSVAVRAKATA